VDNSLKTDVEKDCGQTCARLTQAENTIDTLTASFAALQRALEQTVSNNAALSASLTAYDARLQQADNNNAALTASLTALDTRLQQSESNNAALSVSLNALDTRLQQAEATIASLGSSTGGASSSATIKTWSLASVPTPPAIYVSVASLPHSYVNIPDQSKEITTTGGLLICSANGRSRTDTVSTYGFFVDGQPFGKVVTPGPNYGNTFTSGTAWAISLVEMTTLSSGTHTISLKSYTDYQLILRFELVQTQCTLIENVELENLL